MLGVIYEITIMLLGRNTSLKLCNLFNCLVIRIAIEGTRDIQSVFSYYTEVTGCPQKD